MGENKEKKLLKNTFIYAVANFGAKILTVIIVPFYTYFVVTHDLGIYDIIVTTLSVVVPVVMIVIHEGMYRWLLDQPQKRKIIFLQAFSIVFELLLVFNILFIILSLFIKIPYSFLILLLIDSNILFIMLQQSARGLRKNALFAISGVVYTIVLSFFNVILVFIMRTGITGLLWSLAIAYIVTDVFLAIKQPIVIKSCFEYKNYKKHLPLGKKMVKYSILLLPNTLSWWIMNVSDRYIVQHFLGLNMNGIYSIACKFPLVINMISSIFYLAWQEQAIDEYGNDTMNNYYSKIFNLYAIFLLSGIVILIPFTKLLILHILGAAYRQAWYYTGFLYLGATFSAFTGFYGTGYISAKDTKGAMTTTLYGSAFNIIFNLLFIRQLGLYAVSISTFLGFLIIWALRIIQTKKYFQIHLNLKKIMFLFTLSLGVLFITFYTNWLFDCILTLLALIVFYRMNSKIFHRGFCFVKRKFGDRSGMGRIS